ncbi:suppressor of fused domain protein [Capnocytophaga sp. G2]|uniref:suppressor of fused domain protein n=1 Tax=Capnocytophaga sp. G2 TaxID=3110695 RepID=UPI002B479F98|nr:suppressor of fused domain protein [Capnocytophaga sp. G2]MEB3004128.1 suppressor of fused domain protein [Capnocytophaga sp. G2]
MDLDTYKKIFSEEDAVGWDVIDEVVDALYPNQEPTHYAPDFPASLGGDSYLDGISVYQSDKQEPHFHFVTYGFSNLYYDEKSAGGDYSGFGFELTFRLKKTGDKNVTWAINFLQNIAKYVFTSGNYFEPYHVFPANSPIRLDYNTELIAVAFVLDPELGEIETPHGTVQFLQAVGITSQEFQMLKKDFSIGKVEELMGHLRKDNPLLITDLDRK